MLNRTLEFLRLKKPEMKKRSYEGGGSSGRLRYWPTASGSQNVQMASSIIALRERSRDLCRNVPWMTSAEQSFAANVIGEGITPNPKFDDEKLSLAVKKGWRRWSSQAETSGKLDFPLLQHLVAKTVFTSGECFIRIRPRRSDDGLYLPFQLQVLEPEYVPLDKNETLSNGNKIVMGVEFDQIGRIVAYWMYQNHPQDVVSSVTGTLIPVRVDASQVIHVFDMVRPEQVRGVPWMAAAVIRMNDLKDYEDAEVNRKKTASLFSMFLTSPELDETVLDEDEDEEEGGWFSVPEPGNIAKLLPGEGVEHVSPDDNGQTYDPHVTMQLRSFAATAGLTYEQVTGDLSEVNFSSIRAGLNEMQRRSRRIQRLIRHLLCQRVWNRFIEEMQLSGFAKFPGYHTAEGLWTARETSWIMPGWRYTNPTEEQEADEKAVKAGFKSRDEIILDSGRDPIEVEDRILAERERAKAKGLQFETDAPPKTTAALEAAKISAAAKQKPNPDGKRSRHRK